MHSAGYTISKLEIDVEGTVTGGPCTECKKKAALFLKLDTTGQLLEIDTDLRVGWHGKIRGSATEWGRDRLGFLVPNKHVVLKAVPLTVTRGDAGPAPEGES